MIQNDTIIALATPSGVGAISVIRLSGDNAILLVDANFRAIKKNKTPSFSGVKLPICAGQAASA